MARLTNCPEAGRLLLVLCSLLVFLASATGPVIAADNPDEEIELKRSDIGTSNAVGPEGPAPSHNDSTDDRDAGTAESAHGIGSTGNPDNKNSTDSEMPMPAPSLLRQGNNPQDDPDSSSNSGGRAPFNLGVRQTVMDGGIDDEGTTLQRGTGTIDNQFPTLGGNASKNPPLKGGATGTTLKGGLTQAQLQKLANHDLVLIIDQSGSMHTPDCPISGMGRVGGTVMTMLLGQVACVSRWQWCREQTTHLAEQTRYVSAKGLSVVLFSSGFKVFPHVTLDQIPRIFAQAAPEGGTNLTDPLLTTINDYLQRREITRGNVKPLGIAIITDGRPNNEETVRQVIVEATRRMRNPTEISITIFLIGNSGYLGNAFVNDLQRNLGRYGAKYNIVHAVSFWDLMKVGLPRALADALE